MSFVAFEFLIFFPVVTLLYFLLPHRSRWALLLVASCYFYMCFIPKYILILALTIGVDYVSGILIERSQGFRRRLFLMCSIAANVGVLAFFKYYNFISGNVAELSRWMDWPTLLPALNIILPIGLSFHTFQSLSYTIEVYRGHQKAEYNPGLLAVYVMFYPQLVAGPIERPQNLLRQFHVEFRYDADRVIGGLRLMLWGFMKKVLIADRLALYVNAVYASPDQHPGLPLILATYFFAVQIYCDFSGYTDIARGAARVMGFNLMLNFRRPYMSGSIAEFWKRWHISLSTWFRDYLYIPLGGNRVGKVRWYANLMIVFLVSGLWHGANWTFVIWGGLHGLYLVSGVVTQAWRDRVAAAVGLAAHPALRRALQVLITYHLVWISWVFFRAESLPQALAIFGNMAHWPAVQVALPGVVELKDLVVTLAMLSGLVALEMAWEKWPIPAVFARQPKVLRWACYLAAALAIINLGVTVEIPFIYFQF